MPATLALMLAGASCAPMAGADPYLANRATRWLFVGEQHGTAETPQIFTDLACLAARRRPVVVALEYPEIDQPRIDAFLASDGGKAATDALLTMTNWGPQYHDGRSSKAMLAMLDRLRRMKQAGQVGAVVAFVPRTYGGSGPYNAAMADILRRIEAPESALVLILVGNVHAMTSSMTFGTNTFLPAAAVLSRARTVSLNVRGNGGTAWNCQETCTIHDNGPARTEARGIVPLVPGDRYAGKFDATIELGVPTTASPPALP